MVISVGHRFQHIFQAGLAKLAVIGAPRARLYLTQYCSICAQHQYALWCCLGGFCSCSGSTHMQSSLMMAETGARPYSWADDRQRKPGQIVNRVTCAQPSLVGVWSGGQGACTTMCAFCRPVQVAYLPAARCNACQLSAFLRLGASSRERGEI
jgi:hypothetical protein